MPFEIQNQGTHLLFLFQGRLTPQDVVRLADEAEVVESALPEILDRVADLTGVTEFDVGYTEVRALAVRRRILTFERNIRTAIVANSELQMGMARMFQALNDNPQIEIRIVDSLAKALDWLQEPQTT